MKCGKNSFPTKAEALRASWNIPATKAGLIPVRAYRCGKCKGWHYTSKVGRKP